MPPPPFELRKVLHMAKNATLEMLPQWKITKIVAIVAGKPMPVELTDNGIDRES